MALVFTERVGAGRHQTADGGGIAEMGGGATGAYDGWSCLPKSHVEMEEV